MFTSIQKCDLVEEAVRCLTGKRVIKMKTVSGDDWNTKVWDTLVLQETNEKPPKEEFEAKLQELIDAQPWKELREERNERIARTDYLFTSDYPHATEEVKQAWLDYRQALRDLPANTTDPENPVWPQAPQ
jgi:hypothetical protein